MKKKKYYLISITDNRKISYPECISKAIVCSIEPASTILLKYRSRYSRDFQMFLSSEDTEYVDPNCKDFASVEMKHRSEEDYDFILEVEKITLKPI